jgi:NhaP-type Na+/H+ or K+/H+ antiporter
MIKLNLDRLFKTQREKTIFFATCLVIVGTLLFNWLVLPMATQWYTTASKLSDKRAELKNMNELLKNESNILSEYEQYQKVIRLKDPNKRANDTLLLQVDEIQKELNIHYTRLDPVYRKKLEKSNYYAYTIQVSFDGDLTTAGQFLKGVQERGLYIDYLQITPKAKAAKNPTLQTIVRIGKIVSKEEDEAK